MRSQILIPVLALAAGLVIPVVTAATPAGATAKSTTCRVELDYLDANDEDENGDEIVIDLAGYFYPSSGNVYMTTGDRAYSGNFGNPTTTIDTTVTANFSVRDLDYPVPGWGTVLGSINAKGSTCATLSKGDTVFINKTLSGTDKSYYSYFIKLVMTGL